VQQDRDELVVGVVLELDGRAEAAGQTGVLAPMKVSIGAGYPATMTTRSSRRSSISLTSVSTASRPYWSPLGPLLVRL
jgi:hypothetical protein